MSHLSDLWYVLVEGQTYGPFTQGHMRAFTSEGRIISTSLITTDPTHGFFNASDYPVFSKWQSETQTIKAGSQTVLNLKPTQQIQSSVNQAPHITHSKNQDQTQPHIQQHAQTQNQKPLQAQAEPDIKLAVGQDHMTAQPRVTSYHSQVSSVFLVMAEIRSGQDMSFLQILQGHGLAQRIGDTVWLVRSQTTAHALCTALSETLSKQDRLFVLDSFKNQTAWFNIGADMDSRIREMWDMRIKEA